MQQTSETTELKSQIQEAIRQIKTGESSPKKTGIGTMLIKLKESGDADYQTVLNDYKPVWNKWSDANDFQSRSAEFEIMASSTGGLKFSGLAELEKAAKLKMKNIKKHQTKKIKEKAPSSSLKNTEIYEFEGNQYGKGRLVHAVVGSLLKKGVSLEKIRTDFDGVSKNKYGVANTMSIAQEHSIKFKRYFLNPLDLLKDSSGNVVAVCKEWGTANTPSFIERCNSLGLTVSQNGPC